MKQKCKQILSVLLTLCMALSLLTVTAAAAEGETAHTTRTMTLNLANQSGDLSDAAEGWSWNAETKTLALSGCTIDVNTDDFAGVTAVILPDGATIATEKGTKNVISNRSVFDFGSIGIACDGALTIAGDGELSITGDGFGILARGNVTVNAPVSVSCTGDADDYTAISAETVQPKPTPTITLADSLCIQTPVGGKIVSSLHGQYIAESDGETAARTVVICSAAQSGGDDDPAETPSDKPAEKPAAPKTGDAGITLYIGLAAAAVLVCGAVIAVVHKRKGD